MSNLERLRAQDLKAFVSHYYGESKGKASDYITVYRDFCRHDGNWSATFQTALYNKHSGEYCALLEVLSWHYRDHIINAA